MPAAIKTKHYLPVFFAISCLLFAQSQLYAQQIFSGNTYPLTYFRQPLDISPPALAGSFGELRANHFHSGIDFRTNQREGYPVYAVADGYISRLRVQNSGFGQALYINHPNGYTSVYGHLQRFSPKIAAIVKALQYQNKAFELDNNPDEYLIPIRKGEVIAYSGNRGSSGGPHLHFEIRDSKTEETINPQFFGIIIPDDIPPVIHGLYYYQLNGNKFDQNILKHNIPITGASGSYAVKTPIKLTGEIGFGIVATDRHNGNSGTNGVYSIQLEVDGKAVFTSALECFAFENSRAINAHLDYPTLLKAGIKIQKSFVEPGNPLQIYSNLVNSGRIVFNDGQLHQLKYIVTDAKGNSSILPFTVQAGAENYAPPAETVGITFKYNQENKLENEDVRIIFPKGTLYTDLDFSFKKLSKPIGNAYSNIYQVCDKYTPLHSGFSLAIKAEGLPENLQSKALLKSAGGASQGGGFENGYVIASPKTFGSFYIAIDTVAPSIFPLNISQGKNMAGISKMLFKIRDNLAGIKSFNGYVDGRWVLMEFDTKTATLWYSFDDEVAKGKHSLSLVVADMKDNLREYKIDFTR